MPLKLDYTYGDRWALDRQSGGRPLSEQTYFIYDGVEETRQGDYYLESRPVMLKTIKYRSAETSDEVLKRRNALGGQLRVLALEHFMLPEPLDYCTIPNDHTPGIAGTGLADNEPMLVYAYLPGRTLRQHLQARGRGDQREPFEPQEAIKVAISIADFLTYLHSEGYSHIAVNPDHFLYDRDSRPDRRSRRSLRVLGLSKIAPIDLQDGWARPYELPALPKDERPYTDPLCLAQGRFGLANEWRGLAFLLVYMLTARCPSEDLQRPSDVWQIEKVDELKCCAELKALLREWLTTASQPFDAASHQAHEKNCERLREALLAQGRTDRISEIQKCPIGVFLDFENMWRAFMTKRNASSIRPDVLRLLQRNFPEFDAIANFYAQSERVFKFASVPEFHLQSEQGGSYRQMVQGRIADLERIGWKVELVQAGAEDEDAAADEQLGMDEQDDSALIQAAVNFIELAQPKHIVIISNDRDYLELIEMARNREILVTVVYGQDPAQSRHGLNVAYRQRLEELKVNLRSIYAFPGAFSLEYIEYWERYGLNTLADNRWPQHRAFLCAALIQLGAQGTSEMLNKVRPEGRFNQSEVFRVMERFDPGYYRFCVRRLAAAVNIREEVERLRSNDTLIRQIDPYYGELLNHVYALSENDLPRAREVAAAADRVIDNWDILRGHLNNRIRLGVFTGKEPPDRELVELMRKDPTRFNQTIQRLGRAAGEVVLILQESGLDGFEMLEKYGEQALPLFLRYRKAIARILVSDKGEQVIRMLQQGTIATIAEDWYKQHRNLAVLDFLTGEPRLSEMIKRGGIAAAEVYRAERDLDVVDQVFQLGRAMLYNMEEAHKIWRQIAQPGLNLQSVVESVERANAGPNSPFRKEARPPEELAPVVLSVHRANQAGELSQLLAQYEKLGWCALVAYNDEGRVALDVAERYGELFRRQVDPGERERWLRAMIDAEQVGGAQELADLLAAQGSAFLDVFERYGAQLLPVMRATDPGVIGLLDACGDPAFFEGLVRYGRPAYELAQKYGDAAYAAFARLGATDIADLLVNDQAQAVTLAWHSRRGDLRALDLIAAQPQLLPWANLYGRLTAGTADSAPVAEGGLAVLEAYDAEPDPVRLGAAIRLAVRIGFPLEEARSLLAEIDAPPDAAEAILTTQLKQIEPLPDLPTTVRWVQAVYRSQKSCLEGQFMSAYQQRGMKAVELVERFGPDLLLLLSQTDAPPEALDLLLQIPQAALHIEKYGKLAYRCLKEFGATGLAQLDALRNSNLSEVLSDRGWPVLRGWYQAQHNLDVMVDLVASSGLLDQIHQYGFDVVFVWRDLANRYPVQATELWEQHEAMLMNPAYDRAVLLPLLGSVTPEVLTNVVQKCYAGLLLYQQPEEQRRFCELFDRSLTPEQDGALYLELAQTIRPAVLLAVTEAGGRQSLEFLNTLKPRVRTEAALWLNGLGPNQLAAGIAAMTRTAPQWRNGDEGWQVKLIKAQQYQPIDQLLQACDQYGQEALEEILVNPRHELGLWWKTQRKMFKSSP